MSFHIRPLKTPEDCALAYADAGRLTPEEAQTISAIVAKRAELFPSVELAAESFRESVGPCDDSAGLKKASAGF